MGNKITSLLDQLPTSWKVTTILLSWLIFIVVLNDAVNSEEEDRRIVTMGYMPVITNLAAPILDFASKEADGVWFKALKFASFAEMAEALRNGEIDVAFMIAPLSIVLKQQGEDVKVVYIGNRHESTLVTRKELGIKNLEDLVGKTIAVPMRYSGHNISILGLIENKGLNGRIKVVEMNPPDMAAALAAGSLDAYYVGEPFAAQTLKSGDASRLFYVEDVWDKFICNLVVVRQDLIEKEPDLVEKVVHGAARSGLWAQKNPRLAAELAAKYWNQSIELVEYAMNTPEDRIVYDHYIPKAEEMQDMANRMTELNLLKNSDITGLIDDSFARSAKVDDVTTLESVLQ